MVADGPPVVDPDGPPVTGPHLVREVHRGLVDALSTLWLEVSRSDGAVGFTASVAGSTVRSAAEDAVREVESGATDMFALGSGQALVGAVLLTPGVSAVAAHRGLLHRLAVHSSLRGLDWAGRLLDAAVIHARSMRLEQLLVSARSGSGLPEFYAARGWTEVGRWPRAIRLSADDHRDEVWFQRRLAT